MYEAESALVEAEKRTIVDPMGPSERILEIKNGVELRRRKSLQRKSKQDELRKATRKRERTARKLVVLMDCFEVFSGRYFNDKYVYRDLSVSEKKILAGYLRSHAIKYAAGWTIALASSLAGLFAFLSVPAAVTLTIFGLLSFFTYFFCQKLCDYPYECNHGEDHRGFLGPIKAFVHHEGVRIDFRLKYLFRTKEADAAFKESFGERSAENG